MFMWYCLFLSAELEAFSGALVEISIFAVKLRLGRYGDDGVAVVGEISILSTKARSHPKSSAHETTAIAATSEKQI